MRNILLIAAAMVPLAGDLAHAASANDTTYANLALQELHNLAVASVQVKDATKARDENSCEGATERMHDAALKALAHMHNMSFAPFDAITDVTNFLRINYGWIHDRGWGPACVEDFVAGTNMLPNLARHAIAALRYDYSIGDADWYTINANGEVEAKNPLRYARSLVDQDYHIVKIRPKGVTAMVSDWKAEMASQNIDDSSIEYSGTNLKAVEVDFREKSVDGNTNNTSVFFYRLKEDAQAAKQ